MAGMPGVLRRCSRWLVMASLLLAAPAAHAAERGASAEQPFRIYMIQWRGPTETDRGFTEYFKQEDIPATFIIRNADRKAESIADFVKEIKELKPDLVYVWGGTAPPLVVGRYDAVDPARHVVDIPVVACMVADPIELGVVPNWESSGRNVTGTSHVAPLDVQVRAMQAYAPLQHLAVMYNTSEPGPGVVVAKLKALAHAAGFRLSAWPVPLDAQGNPQADSLPELVRKIAATKPDFLYLGPDSFLGAHRDVVTEAALQRKLPTFVSSEIYIKEANALAGIVSKYYNMGQFCAFKAEQILIQGKSPRDIPFETLKRFSYMIRADTARTVDNFPPIGLLDMADVIDN
ncbi:MAG: ABC transporter substrate-binding protein [Rhodospirillales bacterium]